MNNLFRQKSRLFVVSVVVMVVTAIFSKGFYHPDEHYQILELFNLKLTAHGDMSIFNWDFHERMRSWFQPFLYYILVKPFWELGMKSPFCWATVFRLLNVLLGFFSVCLVAKILFKQERDRLKGVIVTALCWYVPFILCRTSSESLSISTFLIGSYLLLENQNKKRGFLGGVLWGASFLARYQMGIVIGIGFIWFLFFSKKRVSEYLLFAFGFLLMMVIGTAIDWWGYGEFTLAPYNYFYQNLVMNKVSNFGTHPWWYYLKLIVVKGIPPVSLVLTAGVLIYWWKFKKDFFTWVTLAFLIVHSLIGHKELRFLNFVYVLAPMMLVKISVEYFTNYWQKGWVRKLAYFVCVINFLVMLKTSLSPAHSPMKVYSFLYDRDVSSYFVPVEDNGSKHEFTLLFYQKEKLQTVGFELSSLSRKTLLEMKNLVTTRYLHYMKISEMEVCKQVFSIYPKWLYKFNYFKWLERSSLWSVWECEDEKKV